MPLDYSFEHTPSFRDLSPTGLVMLSRPLVRSLRRLRSLRRGLGGGEVPITGRGAKISRRSPLTGSFI